MFLKATQGLQALRWQSNLQTGSRLGVVIMRVKPRTLGLQGAVPVSQVWLSLGPLAR